MEASPTVRPAELRAPALVREAEADRELVGMKLVVRAPALVCAVCAADAYGDLICCEACGVLGHERCLMEAGVCPGPPEGGPACDVLRTPEVTPPRQRARRRRRRWVSILWGALWVALGAVAFAAAICYPSPAELRQREVVEACKTFRRARGRWPRDVAELDARWLDPRARRTRQGGVYQLSQCQGDLLLLWPDGQGGWAAREVR